MRHDTVIWAPRRAKLKDFEHAIASACQVSLAREMAVITPLFHAAPENRQSAPAAQRLRLVTLENGDYQQIHNPADPNFDELFDEWPRVMVHYALRSLDPFASDAEPKCVILECHDLDTNWDKAGWTTGTTMIHQDVRKDRHKILFGLAPWGWTGRKQLEATLHLGAEALAKLLGGKWEYLEEDAEGRTKRLESFFSAKDRMHHEQDPMGEIRSLEDPDVGRI